MIVADPQLARRFASISPLECEAVAVRPLTLASFGPLPLAADEDDDSTRISGFDDDEGFDGAKPALGTEGLHDADGPGPTSFGGGSAAATGAAAAIAAVGGGVAGGL
jgi:hypothetical protein